MSLGVADVGCTVGHGTTYGDVTLHILVYQMERRGAGELRRTIAVEEYRAGLLDGHELLAAQHDVMQARVIGIEQGHSDGSTHGAAVDLVLLDVASHALKVFAQLLAEDMGFATRSYWQEDVLCRGIERETRMVDITFAWTIMEGGYEPCKISGDRGLRDDHPLGFACRSGGVDHVAATFWCSQI